MTTEPELVVLLAEDGTPIGSADKALVHTDHTPLHLAFSCHVVNSAGELLVTRRALSKKTWPGVWTNSFCGHPAPGESTADALVRRAERELGLVLSEVRPALPDFRYQATDASGVVENEICPVFVAVASSDPEPRPDEVAEWAWVDAHALLSAIEKAPFAFSPWLTLQLPALEAAGLLPRSSRVGH